MSKISIICSIILFYSNIYLSNAIQCCTDINCIGKVNCTFPHSHCMVIGRLNANYVSNKFINLSLINITDLRCWMWSHEIEYCPKLPNECYSVHNHSDIRTFCCSGNLCNKPKELKCEIKQSKSIKWTTNEINGTVIPKINNNSSNNEWQKPLTAALIIIILLLLALTILFCVRHKLKHYRHFNQKHKNQHQQQRFNNDSAVGNGVNSYKLRASLINSDGLSNIENGPGLSHVTCLSKLTADTASDYCISGTGNISTISHLSIVNKELSNASQYYNQFQLKSTGKFGEIWIGMRNNKTNASEIIVPISSYSNNNVQSDSQLPEHVAIKIFKGTNETSWQTEIDIYRFIRNRCSRILKYIGYDRVMPTSEDSPVQLWIVTEYMDRGSLYSCLSSNSMPRPQWSDLLRLCQDIAGGLSYLHEDGSYHNPSSNHSNSVNNYYDKPSIAHRDIKSRNILIGGQWQSACICDMGLAVCFHGNRSLSDLHLQVGTERYMAPEILEGAISFCRDAYVAIDVYAMSLVFWEIFSQTVCPLPSQLPQQVYQQPFESELGRQVPLEQLQQFVVNDNKRPGFPTHFQNYDLAIQLWKTIIECWDRDAEARLSSSCVYERLSSLITRSSTPAVDIPSNDILA